MNFLVVDDNSGVLRFVSTFIKLYFPVTLLICAMTIVSCTPSTVLTKPGITQNQWDEDYYECSLTAERAIGFDPGYRTELGNVAAAGAEYQRWFDSCREAKGYRKVGGN
jgi:hypothetical protein